LLPFFVQGKRCREDDFLQLDALGAKERGRLFPSDFCGQRTDAIGRKNTNAKAFISDNLWHRYTQKIDSPEALTSTKNRGEHKLDFNKYQLKDIAKILRHNLRRFSDGRGKSNEDIVPELTPQNYSLVNRGHSVADAKKYFNQLEEEIFHYNRSNVIHAIEWIVTMSKDCPAEEEQHFFETAYHYFTDSLPLGERCVICAEVHKDERFTNKATGEIVSKPAHMHFMYVPAVKISEKEKIRLKEREVNRQLKEEVKRQITTPLLRRSLKKTGMTQDEVDQAVADLTADIRNKIAAETRIPDYKLCADALTKRHQLLKVHPGLQSALDKAGIKATIYTPKKPGTSYIHLSGKQLKQITKATGIVVNHSLTAEELSKIINSVSVKEEQLLQKENELQKVLSDNQVLTEKLEELQMSFEAKKKELDETKAKVADMEKQTEKAYENSWGRNSGWGFQNGRKNDISQSINRGEKEW
jgi:hypothetical protein